MYSIVAIPARLKSVRFPGKLLADIHGHPMLWYVYTAVIKSKMIDDVWIVTDSEEIFEQSRSWGANAIMTSEECPSGTDRIASVIDDLRGDAIINVQGDEPLIVSEVVDKMVDTLSNMEVQVVTPVFKITTLEELTNLNLVKVVRGLDGRALYFSRTPIPFLRDVEIDRWLSTITYWGHMGVYGYRRTVLEHYRALPVGVLEVAEKLEQLRLLESDKHIMTVEISYKPIGVDTPAELEAVKALIDPNIVEEVGS